VLPVARIARRGGKFLKRAGQPLAVGYVARLRIPAVSAGRRRSFVISLIALRRIHRSRTIVRTAARNNRRAQKYNYSHRNNFLHKTNPLIPYINI
jgi:hypothetical protein